MKTITKVAGAMQRVLGQKADEVGRSSGFIQRERQMSGGQFVQMLVFGGWSKPQATVEDLSQTGASLGVSISPQGRDQRLNERAANFLRQVLEAALEEEVQGTSSSLPILARFSAVYSHDSTRVKLPDSLREVWQGCGGRVETNTQAAVKIQVQQDLRGGGICQLWLQNGRDPDQQRVVDPQQLLSGSLGIADVGSFNLAYFASMGTDRYWLSRLKAGVWLFDQTGQATKAY